MKNDFRCCEAENGHGFGFQRSGPMIDEGAACGQPTYCSGTVKKSGLMVGLKFVHVFCVHNIV